MHHKPTLDDLYNSSYAKITPELIASNEIDSFVKENSLGLINFIKSYFNQFRSIEWLKDKNVLEIGCGLGGVGHFLSPLSKSVSGIDISSLAIMHAKELAQKNQLNIDFYVDDICKTQNEYPKFDLIIDSHLFHCLTGNEQRQEYLSFIKTHLTTGGIFLCETMSFNNELQEPLGYDLNSDYILSQEIAGEYIPVRSILPSILIEEEIKKVGLNLNYFFYHNELAFNVFPEYPLYPEFRLPRTIRLAAQLPSA